MSNELLIVEISNQQTFELDEAPLISVVREIALQHHIVSGEISIAIVDDETIHKLNRQYLDHDYPTDVLSFVLESEPEQGRLVGQLIISADTARSNAAETDVDWQHEVMLYAVHGTLHLVGLDDHEPDDTAEMRAAEAKFLAPFGIIPVWNESVEPSQSLPDSMGEN